MPPREPVGQFFVTRTTGWAAWFIRFGTKSEWNHCGVIVGIDGRTVEANPPRVGYGNIHRYKRVKVSRIPLTADQVHTVVQAAQATVGTRYGWADIVADGLLALGVRLPWVVNRAASSKTADCSCDVARIYRAAGIDLHLGKPDWSVTPGDLADVIDHRPVPTDW